MRLPLRVVCVLLLGSSPALAGSGRREQVPRRVEASVENLRTFAAGIEEDREAGQDLKPASDAFFQEAPQALAEAAPVSGLGGDAYRAEMRLAPPQPEEPRLRRRVRELSNVASATALANGTAAVLLSWTHHPAAALAVAAVALFFSEGMIASLAHGRRKLVGYFQHPHDIKLRVKSELGGRLGDVRTNPGEDRWDVYEPGVVLGWERWALRAAGAAVGLWWFV